jgi:hypothetical protein
MFTERTKLAFCEIVKYTQHANAYVAVTKDAAQRRAWPSYEAVMQKICKISST